MLHQGVGRCPGACQGGAGLEKPRSVRKAQSKERKGARVKQSRTGRQSLKWFIQKPPQNLSSVFRYDAAPTSRGSPGRGRWPRAANSHNHGPVSNQPQQHELLQEKGGWQLWSAPSGGCWLPCLSPALRDCSGRWLQTASGCSLAAPWLPGAASGPGSV